MKKNLIMLLITLLIISCKEQIINNQEDNGAATIISLVAFNPVLYSEETTIIVCEASDPEGDQILYDWSADGGHFENTIVSTVRWTAPEVTSKRYFIITVEVNDIVNMAISSMSVVVEVNPRPVQLHTLTLYATDDAYVCSGAPSTNYGSELNLFTGLVNFGSAGDYFYHTYTKFDISNIPNNINIESVELSLHVSYSGSPTKPTGDVSVYFVENSSWNENSINYSNSPAWSNGWITTKSSIIFGTGNTEKFDILNHFKNNMNNSIYSIMVKTYSISTGTSYCSFVSKDQAVLAGPMLIIKYTDN